MHSCPQHANLNSGILNSKPIPVWIKCNCFQN
jgi:hypothetical protein